MSNLNQTIETLRTLLSVAAEATEALDKATDALWQGEGDPADAQILGDWVRAHNLHKVLAELAERADDLAFYHAEFEDR